MVLIWRKILSDKFIIKDRDKILFIEFISKVTLKQICRKYITVSILAIFGDQFIAMKFDAGAMCQLLLILINCQFADCYKFSHYGHANL